ncbi:GAF domain-containing protein [Nocardia sp. NPDC002869]|uniref:GAF domain-containing protein n=1 Tax=Nocardia sp. NPDC002869 TaxID=3161032 RepID=UPI00398CFDCD
MRGRYPGRRDRFGHATPPLTRRLFVRQPGRGPDGLRPGYFSLVAEVDRAQIEFEQGPCLDALYERHTVALPDTAGEVRWPRFAARAAALGIGSMPSFQLYVLGDDLGALNLYARVPRAFDADSERVGRLLAAHAGVAMATAQQVSQLKHTPRHP